MTKRDDTPTPENALRNTPARMSARAGAPSGRTARIPQPQAKNGREAVQRRLVDGPAHPAARRPTQRRQAPADASAGTGLRRAAVVGALALALMFAIGVAAALQQCSPTADAGGAAATSANASANPYNPAGFSTENGRITYSENGQAKSQLGVDVSEHQGSIDWKAVAADGIRFAFVRVGARGYTAGNIAADACFSQNVDGAAVAGLDVGVYFFSQATTPEEARAEADFILQQLAGRYIALPVVFDHETVENPNARANNLGSDTLTACTKAFCERMEEGGYGTAVYGNAGDLARLSLSDLSGRPLWLAEYRTPYPTAQLDFAFWQYTDAGSVAGIEGPVDLNLRFIDARR